MNDLTLKEIETLITLVQTDKSQTEQYIKQYKDILKDSIIKYLQGNINSLILLEYKLENIKKEKEMKNVNENSR
jgi:uroporphyrinogen-III decarboxylase